MTEIEMQLIKEESNWNGIDKTLPIVFWGCGNNASIVKKLLEKKGICPTIFCDNNEKLWGTNVDGVEVVSYEELKRRYKHYVIIITTAIVGAIEIKKQLLCAGETNSILHIEKPFKVDDEFLEYDYMKRNWED